MSETVNEVIVKEWTKAPLLDLQKWKGEDLWLHGSGGNVIWLVLAEEKELAIKAKLKEVDIGTGNGWPIRLAHGFPDSERLYLTQADRKAIIQEGSEYLRRPEMVEDAYGNPIDGSRLQFCCFPDCGCDGARNCMAENGANTCSVVLNREKGL